MSNSFNQFMRNLLIGSFAIAAVSAILMASYMDRYEMSIRDTFVNMSHVEVFSDGDLFDDNGFEIDLRASTSRFDTVSMYKDNTFDRVSNISIDGVSENVVLIREDRDDIRVVFDRVIPDTDGYKLNYEAYTSGDRLHVEVSLRTVGIYSDQDYKGTITVYLPEDQAINQLKIQTNLGEVSLVLPDKIDKVNLSTDYGSLDLRANHPLESLKLSINAGDLHFTTTAPIDKLEAEVDTGSLTFTIDDIVDDVEIENNVGEIRGTMNHSPNKMDVSCNLGDVDLTFTKPVVELNTELNIGDLTIDVANDEDSLVHIDRSLTDMSSTLRRTERRSDANIRLKVDVGDINIY